LNFGLVRRAAQLMLATGAEMAGVMGKIDLVETVDNEQPSDYRLYQNYPNPFSAEGGSASGGNPSTRIKYQIPKSNHVTLKIFDVLGREVATLVDGFESPGYKEVQFNANGLASGVYVYRLQSGKYVESKKLVLLR
jgi:hypothetical protein